VDEEVILSKGAQWLVANMVPILGVSMILVTGTLGWVIAIESRVTVVETNYVAHREVDDAIHDAIRDTDSKIILEQTRNYSEILRRLERIEDGVNSHIRDSNQ
jgi:hypothetical protein